MQSAWKNIQRLEVQLQIQRRDLEKKGQTAWFSHRCCRDKVWIWQQWEKMGEFLLFIISTRGPQERSWVVYITEYCRCHKQHQEPDVPHPWSSAVWPTPPFIFIWCVPHIVRNQNHTWQKGTRLAVRVIKGTWTRQLSLLLWSQKQCLIHVKKISPNKKETVLTSS